MKIILWFVLNWTIIYFLTFLIHKRLGRVERILTVTMGTAIGMLIRILGQGV